jgi:20S proteasome alpha/beta subunit
MTCIIGGKCIDGVVLIGDKKITDEKQIKSNIRINYSYLKKRVSFIQL